MFPQKDFYTDDNRVGGRDSTICCHVATEWHQGHVISFCIGGRTTLLFFILSTSHNIPSLTPSLLIEIKNTIKHTDSINCLPYLSVSISKFQSTWKIDKSEKLNTWIGRFFILSFWPTGDKTCRRPLTLSMLICPLYYNLDLQTFHWSQKKPASRWAQSYIPITKYSRF